MKRVDTDRLANRIAMWLLALQNNFDRGLKRCISGCSLRTLKIIVVASLLLLTSISLWMVLKGISFKEGKAPAVDHITVPVVLQQFHPPLPQDSNLYKRLHSVRTWLDSIRQGRTRCRREDSFIFYRPGLYDSLLRAENLIQSALKR